ncbi:helix-turn-helix domain-containing protein [Actinocorallia longicatena]|uniref:helix-turn-helix domain-containing protein n=1 Tax=Actinocorallia longicatena TaxID=111803 RepID=UPI0031CE3859
MSDNEMSRFLRARREALSPAEVGLPAGDRRRTPGLRRSEVALLADISVEYLTRLEQGRDRNPSPQVLGALADALRLDHDDRLFLRFAAKAATGDAFMRCPGAQPVVTEVRPTIRTLLDRLEPTPALVLNRLGDVIAHTEAYELLAGPVVETGNIIRYVFTDPRARESYPDWERAADDVIAALRHACSPADPELGELVDDLTIRGGAAFTRRYLAGTPPVSVRNGVERQVHPRVGELRLAYETLTLDDVRILTYFPADAATETALTRLFSRDLRAVTA